MDDSAQAWLKTPSNLFLGPEDEISEVSGGNAVSPGGPSRVPLEKLTINNILNWELFERFPVGTPGGNLLPPGPPRDFILRT